MALMFKHHSKPPVLDLRQHGTPSFEAALHTAEVSISFSFC